MLKNRHVEGGSKTLPYRGVCIPPFKLQFIARSYVPARHTIRKAPTFRSGLMLALPIFPASHPASIVGANELNFCVRDGNRWTLIAINTNYVRAVTLLGYTLKTEHRYSYFAFERLYTEPALWSSFRLISISQLHTLLCFHL